LLKTGHKHHLSGFYKFGTPGVAIAWGDADCIDDFMDTLKRAMPQKKFELVFLRPWKLETRPQEWNEVQPPTLKDKLVKLGLPEDDYYTILGVEKKDSKDDTGGKSQGNGKGGKAKGKGKKK